MEHHHGGLDVCGFDPLDRRRPMIGSAAQEEGEPDPAIVQKVEQLGGKVMKIAQNDDGLEVYFHLGRNHEGLRQSEVGELPGVVQEPGAPEARGLRRGTAAC